jgi:glycosyltransferase involved in cell wall biosynthesis
MKIAIVIPTYKKNDNSTIFYLTRALESIKNQTYKNYKVFLIGDKYEDNNEFNLLSKIIDADKIFSINLNYAYERDKYFDKPNILWTCGGVNAVNIGIEYALKDGFEYVAHLDHDDYWSENHLSEIVNVINIKDNVGFVYTLSNFINTVLPSVINDGEIQFSLPEQSNLVHSSTCINFKLLESRYRNMFESFNHIYPSDADLWNQLKIELNNKNINSFLIKKITCTHDKEK